MAERTTSHLFRNGPHYSEARSVPGYARTASGTNFRDKRPCYQTSSSMLWRIDNNTLANDEVHCLLVDVGPNHFEFERVISGQGLAGLRRQQLGPTLNI